MRPLRSAVSAVEASVAAAEAEGVPFVLNARTDAFLRAGTATRSWCWPTRSSAAGPPRGGSRLRVRPGRLDIATVQRLVEAASGSGG